MKHISIFLFIAFLVSISGLQAQQSIVAKTVVFQNNICQVYHNSGQESSKVEFQVVGLSDVEINQFIKSSLEHQGVLSSTISTSTFKGMRTGKMEIFAQADFEFLKNVFVNCGIQFVKVEDELFPIDSWKQFTNEQCSKLTQLNNNIHEIEFKRNWVINNPAEKEKAEQNGWFTQSNGFYNKAVQDKKEFLQSIK